MKGANAISRINIQVLEDVEDAIIMEAFKGSSLTKEDIRKRISKTLMT